MFLGRGAIDSTRIVAPATIERMERTETTTLAAAGIKNGYGLGNYSNFQFQVPTHGHDGGIDGFASDLEYSTEAGVGWVVLVNGGEGAGSYELVQAVGRYLLRDVPPPVAPASVTTSDLSEHIGYYRPAAPRSELFAIVLDLVGGIRVTRAGDTLYQGPLFFGQRQALVPTGSGAFRLAERTVADRAFVATLDGRRAFATGGQYWERASVAPVALLIIGLVLAVIVMAAAVGHALGWIPNRLRGRLRPGPATAVRVWPLAAVLSGVGFVFLAMRYGLSHGSTFNGASAGTFAASLLFPAVSVVALVKTVRANSAAAGPLARRFGMLVAIACLGVAAWLGAYGFLGIRTWRY
jgi:hypothetical protein